MASAVGDPADTSVGKPAAIALCTISNEHRLVIRQKPQVVSRPSRNIAPTSLSNELCRPTSSRTVRRSPSRVTQAEACAQRVRRLKGCHCLREVSAEEIESARGAVAAGTRKPGRCTSFRSSIPHNPQLVWPRNCLTRRVAKYRCRASPPNEISMLVPSSL